MELSGTILAIIFAVLSSLCWWYIIYDWSVEGNTANMGDCLTELQEALHNKSFHVISPYLDASGKPGSGLLEGNMAWLGSYDQCENLQEGNYCLVSMQTSIDNYRNSSANTSQVNGMIRWGLCAVSSCNSTVIKENLDVILKVVGVLPELNVTAADVNCSEDLPFTTGYYVTVTLLSLLVLLCLMGTLSEWYVKCARQRQPKLIYSIDERGPHLVTPPMESSEENGTTVNESTDDRGEEYSESLENLNAIRKALAYKPGRFHRFLWCFSIPTNLTSILDTQAKGGLIPCLNGMRFLSIAWIMLGHTFLGTFSSGVVVNPKAALEYSKRITWQPIGNAYFAVDTFLFLSGLLVTYLSLERMLSRDGKFPLAYYYVHRYIRLTPSMALSMLVWIYIKPYLGSGPIWYEMQSDPVCSKYWWPNLLYIQNFYPTHMENQCIGWTWYLALDMQFYVLAPVVLIALIRNVKLGLTLIGSIIGASIIVTAVLIGVYNIDINLTLSVLNQDMRSASDYEAIIYEKPYCRISTYMVGMLIGYCCHEFPPNSFPMKKAYAGVGWVLNTVLSVTLIFAMYKTFHGSEFHKVENVFYGSLSHTAWALALSWIVCACYYGYGSIVNDVLSWRCFIPLSRLTYSIYLTHPILMFIFNHSYKVPVFVSDTTITPVTRSWSYRRTSIFLTCWIMYYTSVLMLSILLSVLLMLLVELPVLNIERLCLQKNKKQ